jgi:hypothetical protein
MMATLAVYARFSLKNEDAPCKIVSLWGLTRSTGQGYNQLYITGWIGGPALCHGGWVARSRHYINSTRVSWVVF